MRNTKTTRTVRHLRPCGGFTARRCSLTVWLKSQRVDNRKVFMQASKSGSRALEKIHRLRKIGDGFDEALLVWRDENVLARELLEQGCRFAEILRQNIHRITAIHAGRAIAS